jgi:hypothetical protein
MRSDQLPAHNSVTVGCAQSEFSEAPWFVSWLGGNDRPFRDKLPEKLIHALNIPVCEVGVITQFARWSLVRALTEHDPETIARQEAPTRGVYRILLESRMST